MGSCFFVPLTSNSLRWVPAIVRPVGNPKPGRARKVGMCSGYVGIPKPMSIDPTFYSVQHLADGYGMAQCGDEAFDNYLEKCNRVIPELPEEIEEIFGDVVAFVYRYLPCFRQERHQVASHEEALGEMKIKTACGFPFGEYGSKGQFLTPENQLRLYYNFDNVETSPEYTTMADKVESLPKETIARKKARKLRYVNVDFLYKQIRLFLRFAKGHMESEWPRNWVLGGFDEAHGGWERLHRAFDGRSCYGFDGKYYDSAWPTYIYRVVAVLLQMACDFGNHLPVFWFVMDNLKNSKCLARTNEIWQFDNTNCTGHYLTKVFNDLATHAYLATAYLLGCKRNLVYERRFSLFYGAVVVAIVGDDGLISIDGPELHWFTPAFIREVVALVGGQFEFERDTPSRSVDLSYLSTTTVVDDVTGLRLPLHKCGKAVCTLIHSKHDERTIELQFSRCYGVLMVVWPDKRFRHAVREKLEEIRSRLPGDSPLRDLLYHDGFMRHHYLGLECAVASNLSRLKLSDGMAKTPEARKRQRQKRKARKQAGGSASPKSKQYGPKTYAQAMRSAAKRTNRFVKRQGASRGQGKSVSFTAGQGARVNTRSVAHTLVGTTLLADNFQPQLSELSKVLGDGALLGSPIVLSPLMLGQERLARMASMFTEWRPRRLRIRFQPKFGEFVNGSILMAYSRDPTSIPVEFSSSATQTKTMSLARLSNWGKQAETHVSQTTVLECVSPGEWKGDEWLSCCPANAGGIVAKLYCAGIVYVVALNTPTGTDGTTVLDSSLGKLYLDWEIDFRGETINDVALAFAAATEDVNIRSVASVASGDPLQYTIGNSTNNMIGADVLVVYPSNDFQGTGFANAENMPMFLQYQVTTQTYNQFTTLSDAFNGTNAIEATGTTTAVSVAAGTVIPMTQLSLN